jgi:hypothetical protein
MHSGGSGAANPSEPPYGTPNAAAARGTFANTGACELPSAGARHDLLSTRFFGRFSHRRECRRIGLTNATVPEHGPRQAPIAVVTCDRDFRRPVYPRRADRLGLAHTRNPLRLSGSGDIPEHWRNGVCCCPPGQMIKQQAFRPPISNPTIQSRLSAPLIQSPRRTHKRAEQGEPAPEDRHALPEQTSPSTPRGRSRSPSESP